MYIPSISSICSPLRQSAANTGPVLATIIAINYLQYIGHIELCQSLAANSLSVTLNMFWSLSITNWRSYWLQLLANALSQFHHKMDKLVTLVKVLSVRKSLTLNIFLILLMCLLESLYICIGDHLDN